MRKAVLDTYQYTINRTHKVGISHFIYLDALLQDFAANNAAECRAYKS